MTTPQSDEGDFGFQIAPMIDVIFVLMLFFMASAGLQSTDQGLSFFNGGGQSGGLTPTVFVNISGAGEVSVDGQLFDQAGDARMPELRAWFKRATTDLNIKVPVVISPSPETRHEQIVRVLDAAAGAGIESISFK